MLRNSKAPAGCESRNSRQNSADAATTVSQEATTEPTIAPTLGFFEESPHDRNDGVPAD